MRDLLLLAVLLAGLLATLRYPFVGVILWAWFSVMNPHQMAYGAFGLQLNTIIAAATILSIFAHGEYARFRLRLLPALLALFALSLLMSQIFSLNPENSAPYFDRFIKILLFVFIAMQVADTRLRIHALIWILVLGIGYFAAKGALFTLMTLGEYRVQGLPLTVLEDNNHMGIAMATTLPLMLYMREQAQKPLVRRALAVLFAMTVFAIIGTQSRGAFISLVVFAGFFWMRSRRKALYAVLAMSLAVPAIAFMPSKWTERMSTIKSATEDASFMGRVDAWHINTQFALAHPLTGAGLRNPYDKALAAKLDPVRGPRARAAHSIYFEVLGGAGFAALGLYLGILGAAYLSAQRLARSKTASTPDWAKRYGYYAQISLAVFFVGGASTSMEMWDGYWLIIALVAAAAGAANRATTAAGEIAGPRFSWRGRARGAPLAASTQLRKP